MTFFHLTITAFDSVLFNDEVVYCKVTTPFGKLGIEAHHEPLLAVIDERTSITYRDVSGTEESLTAESGLLSFSNNNCLITVSLDLSEK